MSYFITRSELLAILSCERSKLYKLQADGLFPNPTSGLGRNKLFCLALSLHAAHRIMGQPSPSPDLIESHWRSIVQSRLQNSRR
jgi:hypothetical protein